MTSKRGRAAREARHAAAETMIDQFEEKLTFLLHHLMDGPGLCVIVERDIRARDPRKNASVYIYAGGRRAEKDQIEFVHKAAERLGLDLCQESSRPRRKPRVRPRLESAHERIALIDEFLGLGIDPLQRSWTRASRLSMAQKAKIAENRQWLSGRAPKPGKSEPRACSEGLAE